jgi:hypothetical protein
MEISINIRAEINEMKSKMSNTKDQQNKELVFWKEKQK